MSTELDTNPRPERNSPRKRNLLVPIGVGVTALTIVTGAVIDASNGDPVDRLRCETVGTYTLQPGDTISEDVAPLVEDATIPEALEQIAIVNPGMGMNQVTASDVVNIPGKCTP